MGKLKSCIYLFNSEIDLTLSSLETLAKVFDHPSCSLTPLKAQVQYKPYIMFFFLTLYTKCSRHPYRQTNWVLFFIVNKGSDMDIENLLCKISALVSLLSSLEKKVRLR